MNINEWLISKFKPIEPFEFYRSIFPEGELEKRGEYVTGKYTGIVIAVASKEKKPGGKRRVYRYNLTDDLDVIRDVTKTDNFCLCSPLSYAGKNRTAENARLLYAIAIDLDRIRLELNETNGVPLGVDTLWHQITKAKILPKPTYIVSSGTGLHLYYVLQEPIKLFPKEARELQALKRELTNITWNPYITTIQDRSEIQQEGIYQGFRMPGTITKNGGRARAYITGEKVSIEYLNSFVSSRYTVKIDPKKRGKIGLEEAKKYWPEWYERRVVQGQKRGVWNVNRAVYDSWLKRIREQAQVGHRYYCIMTLAIYAQKCSHYDEKHNPNPVTREELERDCFSLLEKFELLTNDPNNHFTADDILSALDAFDARWTRYPIESIANKSGLEITRNKRNGRKQNVHLAIARETLKVLNKSNGNKLQGPKAEAQEIIANWALENPEGTRDDCIRDTGFSRRTVYTYLFNCEPTKSEIIKQWRTENPEGSKAKCIADTGISKQTVYTYWDGETKEKEKAIKEAIKEQKKKEKQLKEFRKLLREMSESLESASAGDLFEAVEKMQMIKSKMEQLETGPESPEK